MDKIGLGLLYLWIGFNCALALFIVVGMIFFRLNAPVLTILFDNDSIKTLSPNALGTINALAILMNSTIVALCSLSSIVIWEGLLKKQSWSIYSVGICLMLVQG